MKTSRPEKILIIQTAFIGDVILATSIAETLGKNMPEETTIDFLVRKGNESLLKNNPHIGKILIWDKKNGKYSNLFKIFKKIRQSRYDRIINIQRFASTGFLTAFSGAKIKTGFRENPLSFLFTQRFEHKINTAESFHEIHRNHMLISGIPNIPPTPAMPRLYPSDTDYNSVKQYQSSEYVVIAPASVWFTKQLPTEKWTELVSSINKNTKVIFVGGDTDKTLSDKIIFDSKNDNCINLCGQLTFLESAALMKGAKRNVVNDSAPLHIASATDAPVTAVFCSTVPEFGFGPLSAKSAVVEVKEKLECRPCGLHGKKECPEGHFDCGHKIDINEILKSFG